MADLFKSPSNIFRWKNIKSYLVRSQYNELLKLVTREYFTNQYTNPGELPRFLNTERCLTLVRSGENCNCEVQISASRISKPASNDSEDESAAEKFEKLRKEMTATENTAKNAASQMNIDSQKLDFKWQNFQASKTSLVIQPVQEDELEKLARVIEEKRDVKAVYDAVVSAISTASTTPFGKALKALQKPIEDFEKSFSDALNARGAFQNAAANFDKNLREAQLNVEVAMEQLNIATSNCKVSPTTDNEKKKRDAEIDLNDKKRILFQVNEQYQLPTTEDCLDAETDYFCLPHFTYKRKQEVKVNTTKPDFLKSETQGLTVGAVYWLYNYERMGIFKILGVLLDDYNYKGQYTISGNRIDNKGLTNPYSTLIDLISTLNRLGISSNLRDRISTYQRVLGITIGNNLGIESERNIGLMQTFATLNNYMLQYYADKRLATAIQTGGTSRSSVATQTSIKDTLTLFQQQLEPFQYGRNQINTFLGIATVHATLCLLYMLRKEIGIPDQYEAPDEFVQAAYEILVLKRTAMINEKNRFVLYDNCASYGYRLFTDFELLNVDEFDISSDTNSTFNQFLDDSESKVEGLRNALASLPEGADFLDKMQ